MIYTLAYRCFKICSNWIKFYEEFHFFKNLFLKDGYPLLFIDKCFKMVITTVEKRTLILSLLYLGDISLQTRIKLRKSFRGILNCCKLQIISKSQRKLANVFRFKDRLPFDLVSGVVYEYTCERCNSSYYGQMDRQMKVRSAEHIEISLLTFRKVKLSKESAVRVHLLNCSIISSFDEFTILAYEHHKYLLEMKISFFVKRDRPVLNKNISSAKLFHFIIP